MRILMIRLRNEVGRAWLLAHLKKFQVNPVCALRIPVARLLRGVCVA
jgi:hypothetical protein